MIARGRQPWLPCHLTHRQCNDGATTGQIQKTSDPTAESPRKVAGQRWCALTGSNRRPAGCKPAAGGFSPPFGAVAMTCRNAVLTCDYMPHAHCTSFRNFPHLYAPFWTYVRQICVKSGAPQTTKRPPQAAAQGGQLQIIRDLVRNIHRRVRVPPRQLPHHPQRRVVLPPQRRHLTTQIPNVCL